MSREGIVAPWPTVTDALPDGTVLANDHTGWSPLGAVIVTRMREPARYA
jgi:hypothetical protein